MDVQLLRETLELVIERDAETGLPLLSHRRNILNNIEAYLPLPYSVAEYGCGKKASLILRKLIELGVPHYALQRGMIMEKDMSPAALEETDFHRREHAMTIDNPLHSSVDPESETLSNMLREEGVVLEAGQNEIHSGPYRLRLDETLQFVLARSHIFPILTFWDADNNRPVDLAIDPTVDSEGLFEAPRMRVRLNAPEALILTAPMLGRFRLDPDYLTPRHREEIEGLGGLDENEGVSHRRLILQLTGAVKGSIGDPDVWTYANNVRFYEERFTRQRADAGRGEPFRALVVEMLEARTGNRFEEVLRLRDRLEELGEEVNVLNLVREDAAWSEAKLGPLAVVANTVSLFHSLDDLAEFLKSGASPAELLGETRGLELGRGFGVRLRNRIERLSAVSRTETGEIDARALSPLFFQATLETIRQMNRAGLAVFVDKAGNLHGLLVDDDTRAALREGRLDLREIARRSICLCSHIDTVNGAGQYDGRLGVLSGIEIARIFTDLHRFFGIDRAQGANGNTIMVSAFLGEEMTFTGNGVAMPGSAAVAGLATLEQIHGMQNAEGEVYRDRLLAMLEFLRSHVNDGGIQLMNRFEDDGDLLEACCEPEDFFVKHTYERHIEQGPVLDRKGAPLVIVDAIMGIHQEDFVFEGECAEAGALEFNRRIRKLALAHPYRDHSLRVTVGVIEADDASRRSEPLAFGLRWTLAGEKNHAGATLMEDRHDPGVAAGRLAEYFSSRVRDITEEGRQLIPVVGAVELLPGINRNVIPGEAAVTLGIQGRSVDRAVKQWLSDELQHHVFTTLAMKVARGGEGVVMSKSRLVPLVTLAERVRLSIDVRCAEPALLKRFLDEVRTLEDELGKEFDVTIDAHIEQEVAPVPLHLSGQILQIERSYGGSHNPNEAELANDIVRGTLLQFDVTREILHRPDLDNINLFELAAQRIPREWQERSGKFVSGALHDTCNIARRVLTSSKKGNHRGHREHRDRREA